MIKIYKGVCLWRHWGAEVVHSFGFIWGKTILPPNAKSSVGTLLLNRAHREPVAPVVVVLWINTTIAKAQVPRIKGRVERSRPVATARTTEVPRCTTADAGASKKQPIAIYLGL